MSGTLPNRQFHLIIQGDVRDALAMLPTESVDCVVSSPPYWGLRDYGNTRPSLWDGQADCGHEWGRGDYRRRRKGNPGALSAGLTSGGMTQAESTPGTLHQGSICSRCGAWKGQLGLEPTFQLYVNHIVEVFRRVQKVLKPTGTMFLNLGDTYCPNSRNWGSANPRPRDGAKSNKARAMLPKMQRIDLPNKCLIGIPERIMLGLIGSGWILRNKIVWAKTNHMPSSVRDRFSSSWEVVYFLVKEPGYRFDLDAVRVPLVSNSHAPGNKSRKLPPSYLKTGHRGTSIPWHPPNPEDDSYWEQVLEERASMGGGQRRAYLAYLEWKKVNPSGSYAQFYEQAAKSPRLAPKMSTETSTLSFSFNLNEHLDMPNPGGKNPGDVWEITTQPFPEAHFATFPEAIPERAIRAGCPESGITLDPFRRFRDHRPGRKAPPKVEHQHRNQA